MSIQYPEDNYFMNRHILDITGISCFCFRTFKRNFLNHWSQTCVIFCCRDYRFFIDFCEKLKKKVPDINMWCASCLTENSSGNWQGKILASPISCPPAILKEKQLSEAAEVCNLAKWIPESHTRTPTEGPPIKYMYHGGDKHSEGDPQDCQTCAAEAICYLQTLFTSRQHVFFFSTFLLPGDCLRNS